MLIDIQKPGIMRRVAAGIFDFIILVVLATGIGWGISALVDTDGQYTAIQDIYTAYGEKYDVDFNISSEDYAAMTTEEQELYTENYNAALEEMNNDEAAVNALMDYWSAVLTTISLAVLLSHLILEFALPLLLKNGQTLGKKIFNIGLMRKDGVKIPVLALFVRSMMGKCTVEIMVPILILGLMLMGMSGILIYLVMALAIAQVVLLFRHPRSCMLHDLMACTVAVDLASQLIFDSPEALEDYQKARAAEAAERADY